MADGIPCARRVWAARYRRARQAVGRPLPPCVRRPCVRVVRTDGGAAASSPRAFPAPESTAVRFCGGTSRPGARRAFPRGLAPRAWPRSQPRGVAHGRRRAPGGVRHGPDAAIGLLRCLCGVVGLVSADRLRIARAGDRGRRCRACGGHAPRPCPGLAPLGGTLVPSRLPGCRGTDREAGHAHPRTFRGAGRCRPCGRHRLPMPVTGGEASRHGLPLGLGRPLGYSFWAAMNLRYHAPSLRPVVASSAAPPWGLGPSLAVRGASPCPACEPIASATLWRTRSAKAARM